MRRVDQVFCLALPAYLLLALLLPGSAFTVVAQLVLIFLTAWIAFRLARIGMRKAIWGLRNRLLVTYLFIAVVPVSLILVLAGLGAYTLVSQLAVYLTASDLERRSVELSDIARNISEVDSAVRPAVVERTVAMHRSRFPGLTIDVAPVPGWKRASGVMVRRGAFYLWCHASKGAVDVNAQMPLSRAYLSAMVPGLNDVSLLEISDSKSNLNVVSPDDGKLTYLKNSREPPANSLPAPSNRFDIDVHWFSMIPVWRWEIPNGRDYTLLHVHTRPSALLNTIFNTRMDQLGQFLPIALLVMTILFLMVETAALIIGASLARTITRAVHNIYEGTQRVIQGDFAHRIQVHGKDQLAELGTSFNKMTENLEQLLAVAKEKERLEAEVEIARQVQEQLYPKVTPALRTLQLTATCRPARMVSGDYYDYLCLPDGRLAIAVGDVAGKGISAALLMASIQAAMRMELRSIGFTGPVRVPTSQLVSDLNQQLHATTSPEKYATFFFALYNENDGELTYTNAGHLSPLLVRNGVAIPLESSGTVIGAFPFAKYEENRIQMQSGDLLVGYTDGITEPENEYGEEFGEARLIDLIAQNAEREDKDILEIVLDAVTQWTSAVEQPDDMTLLLARRIC